MAPPLGWLQDWGVYPNGGGRNEIVEGISRTGKSGEILVGAKQAAPLRALACEVQPFFTTWELTSFVSSNIVTESLPSKIAFSFASPRMVRLSLGSWRLFWRM